jgi:hypothetical protein
VAACPCPADCGPGNITCVPEHYCKETKKWTYNSGCEPFCLCFWPSLFGGCGCDSGHCEPPYHRHYLIKKLRICREDAIKCVPAPAGCTDNACYVPAPTYFPNSPGPRGPAPQAPAPGTGPRTGGPMPMPIAYGAQDPSGTFGGGTAFTPAAPPSGFGSPATAFSPGR